MRFKIDWASLIVRREFNFFALLYFVFEGNFQVQAPWGLIFGGEIYRRVFCVTSLGAYTWMGLFSEFTVVSRQFYTFVVWRKREP